MSTKHTIIEDHKIENFRGDLRRFLFQANICLSFAHILMQNPLRGVAMADVIKAEAHKVFSKLERFNLMVTGTINSTKIELNYKERAILEGVNADMDVDGDKLNNIANLTSLIGDSPKDYTDKIDFVFSRERQKQILKRYFLKGGGTEDEFELYHAEEREYVR